MERLDRARDDKEREKGEKWLEKLRKREPSKSDFRDKTSCRLDWRTGVVEQAKDKGKFPLWIHISTLEKGKTIDIPLNPSVYHLNQLKDVVVDDFEIIKGGNSRKKKNKNKYYIHSKNRTSNRELYRQNFGTGSVVRSKERII